MFVRAEPLWNGAGFMGAADTAPTVLYIADPVAFAPSPSSNFCTTILESLVETFACLYNVT